jgi:hypothetical protein
MPIVRLDGKLEKVPMRPDPAFRPPVPEACPDVPRETPSAAQCLGR